MKELQLDTGLENKTIVLMMTCKKFEQLWDPFFILFKKYWPNCPYKIIMGTDTGSYPGIQTIQTGKDNGWANNAIDILNKIDAERIIMFFDDFLPYAEFNNDIIRKLVRHSYDFNVGCLRLMPCPGPTSLWHGTKHLGVINENDPYRFSLQAAIWDRKLLLELIKPGEDAWETEVNGSKRSNFCYKPFLSVWRDSSEYPGGPTPYIVTAVVKGVWLDSALELLKKENIPMDKITKAIK